LGYTKTNTNRITFTIGIFIDAFSVSSFTITKITNLMRYTTCWPTSNWQVTANTSDASCVGTANKALVWWRETYN
jgi:hypothetical protein